MGPGQVIGIPVMSSRGMVFASIGRRAGPASVRADQGKSDGRVQGMSARKYLIPAVLFAAGCGFAGQASATTTLAGSLTADNAFYAYLSTSETNRGTLIGSGTDWGQTYSFAGVSLTAGVTYYLHIEVINYGGPYGLLGSLSLSGSDFSFGNGSQTLNTDLTNWRASLASANGTVAQQPWVPATGQASYVYQNGIPVPSVNGDSPWGFHLGISPTATWIDAAGVTDQYNGGYETIDYSTTITYSGAAAPEPASAALFGAGLFGMGWVKRRLRRPT